MFLAFFFYSTSIAQVDVKYIKVPGLSNNAQIFTFLSLSNGNNLIATNQYSAGVSDSYIIETDYAGNYISSSNFQTSLLDVKICSDNGFFLLFSDFTLMKMDSSFTISWTKKISPLNSSYSLIGNKMIAELDGYYYLLASMEDSVFNPGVGILSTFDLVLFKFDSLGNLLNHKIISDSTHTSNSFNRYVRSFNTGKNCLYAGLSLLGWWAGGTCNENPAIMKIDTSLSVKWTYDYHTIIFNSLSGIRNFENEDVLIYGIHSDNYPFCSFFRPYLIKTDSSGNVLYSKSYYFSVSAECHFNDLMIYPDSTATLSVDYTDTISGTKKLILARVDQAGSIINSLEINSNRQSYHPELKIVSNSGGLLNVCQIYNTDTVMLIIEDHSFSGYCLNVPAQVYDSSSTSMHGIINSHYISYNFSFSDTSLLPVQPPVISSINFCTTLGENMIAGVEDILIFPNPSTGRISFRSDENILDLQISDLRGKIIHHSNPNEITCNINLIESGLYIVKLTTASSAFVREIQILEHR